MDTTPRKPTLQKIPVYEVRLVRSRRPLRLAEATVSDGELAAKALHALIGLTDREHFAALFLNGLHQVTGAHVIAVGGQHGIGTIEARTVFRAAITACASGVVLCHSVPGHRMTLLLPCRLCGGIWPPPGRSATALVWPAHKWLEGREPGKELFVRPPRRCSLVATVFPSATCATALVERVVQHADIVKRRQELPPARVRGRRQHSARLTTRQEADRRSLTPSGSPVPRAAPSPRIVPLGNTPTDTARAKPELIPRLDPGARSREVSHGPCSRLEPPTAEAPATPSRRRHSRYSTPASAEHEVSARHWPL